MPNKTKNWEFEQPLTGEQDLAESVSKAYEDIDEALFSPQEKAALKGQYSEAGDEGTYWKEEKYSGTNVNIMHTHPVPNKVPLADSATHADAASKVDNALKMIINPGTGKDDETATFDGSAQVEVELSKKGHTHSIRDIDSMPWVYTGTGAPGSGDSANAQTGDLYIRFVS